MNNFAGWFSSSGNRTSARGAARFAAVLLLIEFFDELVFGTREAAWPLIRDELKLSYTQIGLLLSIPHLVAGLLEPVLGILADVWNRRALILGGGLLFVLSMFGIASANGFAALLIAFVVIAPASGAFVSLSQAALMDADPDRREHNMARWAAAGSFGMISGAVLLGASASVNADWRTLFVIEAFFGAALVFVAGRFRIPTPAAEEGEPVAAALGAGLKEAFRALRSREVLRSLALLSASDLMLDVFHGFLALYFVDVVGASRANAALSVVVWTVIGFPGDLFLIALLRRMKGLAYLRLSAWTVLLLFPTFLLVPGVIAKWVVLGFLGLFNAGWYSILKARLYGILPGRSGTVTAIDGMFTLVQGLIPVGLGLAAEHLGLAPTMWLLLLGPIVLLVLLPGD